MEEQDKPDKSKDYYIDSEQLYLIRHFKEMFDYFAKDIKELCKEEHYDIEYGFKLGEVHTNLMRKYYELMALEDDISKQTL